MADKLVVGKLSNGDTVLFEVEDTAGSGPRPVAIGVQDGSVDVDAALAGVRQAASQVLDTVRSIAVPLESCEISFGVKLSGTLGAVIAKATTEANFTIKLVWKSSSGDKA